MLLAVTKAAVLYYLKLIIRLLSDVWPTTPGL